MSTEVNEQGFRVTQLVKAATSKVQCSAWEYLYKELKVDLSFREFTDYWFGLHLWCNSKSSLQSKPFAEVKLHICPPHFDKRQEILLTWQALVNWALRCQKHSKLFYVPSLIGSSVSPKYVLPFVFQKSQSIMQQSINRPIQRVTKSTKRQLTEQHTQN